MEQIVINGIGAKELLQSVTEIVKSEIKDFHNQHQQPKQQEVILLTRKEVASLLSISLVTLNEWTKTKKIPSIKIGSRVRYDRDEVLTSIKKA